jgi:hypothetical protein
VNSTDGNSWMFFVQEVGQTSVSGCSTELLAVNHTSAPNPGPFDAGVTPTQFSNSF